MKKVSDIIVIIAMAFVIVHSVWLHIDMDNAIDEHNAGLDDINAELSKIEQKMMRDLLIKYDKIAKQDTLTLEQKVDIMSVVLANYMGYSYGFEGTFTSEPFWDQWIKSIKESNITRINKEEKE